MEATKRCPFCAEEILQAAVKCKHCGSSLLDAPAQSRPQPSTRVDLGWAILAIPVAGTLVLWSWVANMSLLQGPGGALALVIAAVVISTGTLCAIEASKLGMQSNRQQGTYSPTSWAFLLLLFWIVGYPAYLFKRRKYGVANRLALGLFVAAIFLGSAWVLSDAIDAKVQQLRNLLPR